MITVKAGEIVGYVGSSGGWYNSSPPGTDTGTTPHLHFQMWVNGELTNPYSFLKSLQGK
jgi:murein DD-endopeptidase MepM/ murein hydrolase activator NlpD